MFKNSLRKIYLQKRNEYTDHYVKKNSLLIKDILLKNFNFNKINIIHIFLSTRTEVNTFIIIDEILSLYKHINFINPRINGKNDLLHFYFKNSILKKNKYGILEPIQSKKFKNLSKIDMIIIPLLCFDKKGNRVGYGKGYYDKFLCQTSGIKIGVSLENPIELINDIKTYDIKLNYCITPKKIYKFKQ